MGHVILLGDSIFDNARYVPDRPPVVEQVRRALPKSWQVTLLAVDGHMTEDVPEQLTGIPTDATHLFISAGGNDAIGESSILSETACTVGEALGLVQEVLARFRNSYRAMLQAVSKAGKPTTVCTVYDSIPGLGAADRTALSAFNEIITYEAFRAGLPLVDLRLICCDPSDYSHLSSIEPSMTGGSKIARVIAEVATTHDFNRRGSVIYT